MTDRPESPRASPAARTVLIADDEANLRLMVRATIETDGVEVLEARDGTEAWSLLVERRPGVAILDWSMPVRTGLDLCQAIRADPSLRDMRVILLTARSQDKDIAEGYAAGADVYLTKPFSPLELLQTLEEVLGPVS